MKNRLTRKYRKHIARLAVSTVKVYSFHPTVNTNNFVRKAKKLNLKAIRKQFVELVDQWGTDLNFDSLVVTQLIKLL